MILKFRVQLGMIIFQNIVVKMNRFVIRCMKYIFNKLSVTSFCWLSKVVSQSKTPVQFMVTWSLIFGVNQAKKAGIEKVKKLI